MATFIVEAVRVEFTVRDVVKRVLMDPVDTFIVIKSPDTSTRVELTRRLLTTMLFSFKSLVHFCLASEPTIHT